MKNKKLEIMTDNRNYWRLFAFMAVIALAIMESYLMIQYNSLQSKYYNDKAVGACQEQQYDTLTYYCFMYNSSVYQNISGCELIQNDPSVCCYTKPKNFTTGRYVDGKIECIDTPYKPSIIFEEMDNCHGDSQCLDYVNNSCNRNDTWIPCVNKLQNFTLEELNIV